MHFSHSSALLSPPRCCHVLWRRCLSFPFPLAVIRTDPPYDRFTFPSLLFFLTRLLASMVAERGWAVGSFPRLSSVPVSPRASAVAQRGRGVSSLFRLPLLFDFGALQQRSRLGSFWSPRISRSLSSFLGSSESARRAALPGPIRWNFPPSPHNNKLLLRWTFEFFSGRSQPVKPEDLSLLGGRHL